MSSSCKNQTNWFLWCQTVWLQQWMIQQFLSVKPFSILTLQSWILSSDFSLQVITARLSHMWLQASSSSSSFSLLTSMWTNWGEKRTSSSSLNWGCRSALLGANYSLEVDSLPHKTQIGDEHRRRRSKVRKKGTLKVRNSRLLLLLLLLLQEELQENTGGAALLKYSCNGCDGLPWAPQCCISHQLYVTSEFTQGLFLLLLPSPPMPLVHLHG